MKALTIKQPFVEDIIFGEKTEEYRSWSTDHRGQILICASAGGHLGKDKKYFVCGHAVCTADITDVKKKKDGYAWQLSNVRLIKPIPIKGQQRLFNADVDIEYIDIDNEDDLLNYWLSLGLIEPYTATA